MTLGHGYNWLVIEARGNSPRNTGAYCAFSLGRYQFRCWPSGPRGSRLQFWRKVRPEFK